jgi:hypothetical protein
MILVPELMKLGNSRPTTPLTKELVKKIAGKRMGVAVLTPSGKVAETWTDVARYPDKSNEVSEAVSAMQAGKDFGPLVLAMRLALRPCHFNGRFHPPLEGGSND